MEKCDSSCKMTTFCLKKLYFCSVKDNFFFSSKNMTEIVPFDFFFVQQSATFLFLWHIITLTWKNDIILAVRLQVFVPTKYFSPFKGLAFFLILRKIWRNNTIPIFWGATSFLGQNLWKIWFYFCTMIWFPDKVYLSS